MQADHVGARREVGGGLQQALRQRAVRVVDSQLGRERAVDPAPQRKRPVRRLRRVGDRLGQRPQQGGALGRIGREHRRAIGQLERIADRGSGHQLQRRRRQRHRHQAEIELSLVGFDPQLGDDIVEDRYQLRDVRSLVAEVGRGPGGEIAPRFLRHRQAALGIGRERDLVQRRRHPAGEQREILFAARLRVVLRANRLRIAIGSLPIDERFGDREHLQPWFGAGISDRHRKHHTVANARELAVADERAAVLQKDPEDLRRRGRMEG